MKVTDKQAYVLQNLHRIEITSEAGKRMYMLDGESCRNQIIGLAARGIVAWTTWGKPSQIADPTGVTRTSWKRPGLKVVQATPAPTASSRRASRLLRRPSDAEVGSPWSRSDEPG